MPSVMKILGYNVFFWSNEGKPLEPIHVHIGKTPMRNATKVWILSDGKTKLDNNNSNIKQGDLKRLLTTIENFSQEIIDMWKDYYKELTFFDQTQRDIVNSDNYER